MSSLGFTGTQEGMTDQQLYIVEKFIHDLHCHHAHHGDCIGADAEFHSLCRKIGYRPIIHIHPPTNPKKRAFCKGDVIYSEAPYLKRNRNIVIMSDILIAAPKEYREKKIGSGTWATIRYGEKKPISVIIVYPDGSLEHRGLSA